MNVNVNFDLNIEPKNWADNTVDISDPQVAQRIAQEVREHAESVVRDLFEDQCWTVRVDANA